MSRKLAVHVTAFALLAAHIGIAQAQDFGAMLKGLQQGAKDAQKRAAQQNQNAQQGNQPASQTGQPTPTVPGRPQSLTPTIQSRQEVVAPVIPDQPGKLCFATQRGQSVCFSSENVKYTGSFDFRKLRLGKLDVENPESILRKAQSECVVTKEAGPELLDALVKQKEITEAESKILKESSPNFPQGAYAVCKALHDDIPFAVYLLSDDDFEGFDSVIAFSVRLACEIPKIESSELYKGVVAKYGQPAKQQELPEGLKAVWKQELGDYAVLSYLSPINRSNYSDGERYEFKLLTGGFRSSSYQRCPRNSIPNQNTAPSSTFLEVANSDYLHVWLKSGARRHLDAIANRAKPQNDAAQRKKVDL